MSNTRRTPSPNEHIVLIAEVNSSCPLCGTPLMYDKKGNAYKDYEVAHIYPLNPTREEQTLLADEEKLSTDVNNRRNLIPLCRSCHKRFDTPRTAEDYRKLMQIKRDMMKKAADRSSWGESSLNDAVRDIVEKLASTDFTDRAPLTMEPQTVESKVNASMTPMSKNKIRNDVRDYFSHVRELFKEMEKNGGTAAELVAAEIRTFYLKQKTSSRNQQQIYESISGWIQSKTGGPLQAAEVVTAFFIQNCEVFE